MCRGHLRGKWPGLNEILSFSHLLPEGEWQLCWGDRAHKAVGVSCASAGNSLGLSWRLKLSADEAETPTPVLHLFDFIGRGNKDFL